MQSIDNRMRRGGAGHRPSARRWREAAVAALIALAAAACAKPTPYVAATDGYGYSDQRLDDRTYRVTVAGNSVTSRETVEDQLLYRAAEIALQNGHDRFRIVEQDTEQSTEYRTMVSGPPGWGFAPFPYYGYGWPYFSAFRPFPGPYMSSTQPITRYEAYALVRLVDAGTPEDDRTFDASEVVANLGPVVLDPTGVEKQG